MLDKIGDSNVRIRENAHKTLLAMTEHHAIGVFLIVESITKGQVKETTSRSYRHIHGRMNLLKEIIKRYDVNTKDVPLETVLSYALTGFKHPREEVRAVAYTIVFELYKVLGAILRSYLGTMQKDQQLKYEDGSIPVNKSQMNILEQGFKSIDDGYDITDDEEMVKRLMKSSSTKAEKIIDEGKSTGRIRTTRQSRRSRSSSRGRSVGEGEYSCQFCKKTGFSEEHLDLHQFQECKMLFKCWECDQIDEIGDLNNHLLKNCAHKDKFYKCITCQQAIYKDAAVDHERDGCHPPKNKKTHIRCPL